MPVTKLAQFNNGWCTPGVHAPEVTGGNGTRVSRSETSFTRDRAWGFYGSTPPSRTWVTGPGSLIRGLVHFVRAQWSARWGFAVFGCRRCCGLILLIWLLGVFGHLCPAGGGGRSISDRNLRCSSAALTTGCGESARTAPARGRNGLLGVGSRRRLRESPVRTGGAERRGAWTTCSPGVATGGPPAVRLACDRVKHIVGWSRFWGSIRYGSQCSATV